ncbi:SH3 domain-containing protein [Cellulophaga lytica]|nr:SH3 domain-containing protein [Cellulophaga lytica]
MIKKSILLFCFIFCYHISAQNIKFPDYGHIRTGVINDADGYVNVRQGKNSSSKIIARINKNDEFKFALPEAENEKWTLVKTTLNEVGYVYFNRIYELRKDNCADQVELIDQTWEHTRGGFGSRTIDSIPPNLKEISLNISQKNRAKINKLLSCALENIDLFENNNTEKTLKFTQKTYKTSQNANVVVTEYYDSYSENLGTVISIIENGEMESYAYYGYLSSITIYALKKVDGYYRLYGNLEGSPGDCYGGNFTLELINKSWVYKFEYYEFNG